MVENGKEATEMLDAMHDEYVAYLDSIDPDVPDPLDPFGDHPEALAAVRREELGTPDGMSLQEAPMGVIR